MALTQKRIAALSKKGRYSDGYGLYLQINEGGAKSWLLRYERGGKEHFMGLGPLHTFSLAEAREKARAERQKLFAGIDPLEAKRADVKAKALAATKQKTFEQVAQDYYNAHESSWSNPKHRKQFLSSLKAYAFPRIGNLPVAAIDTGHVLSIIEPLWLNKTETASRVRGRIESILDYATARNYRTGDNPARWRGHIEHMLPKPEKVAKGEHHAALPYASLPTLLSALKQREGVAARALEFLILTAARSGEVLGAVWDEIDLEAKVWTVPAGRMKARKEHRVPLSPRALEILQALPREAGNPHVFIGSFKGRAMNGMALTDTLTRMGETAITVHGFRSSFRDWCGETTAYAREVIEHALAHGLKDQTEAAYARGTLMAKRARLMADWASFCGKPQNEAHVLPIRGRG